MKPNFLFFLTLNYPKALTENLISAHSEGKLKYYAKIVWNFTYIVWVQQ